MVSNQPVKANVVWAPFPGSQTLFLTCPVFECLYEGTRGPGKTDSLLMSFAMHTGRGHGRHWRGILFRETYKQLDDIVAKSKRWFSQIFPQARFNEQHYIWKWPGGEELLLRYMDNPNDYWNYHGHEYPWIGWEELTNWATKDCYESMMSCCRSSYPGIPRMYRATCNPHGLGHNWVKARWKIGSAKPGEIIQDDKGRPRTRVTGYYWENKALVDNDPEYLMTLESITDPNKRKAWLEGSWDIVAGGSFDDLWDSSVHVLQPFDVPAGWTVFRSYDDGDSKPFSVGWWTVSNGTDVRMADGTTRSFPANSVFRIHEWYGWNGSPNEGSRMLPDAIARGIKEIEVSLRAGICSKVSITPGPADNSIFEASRGKSVASQMATAGVTWQRSNKNPGSRIAGVKLMRTMLSASTKERQDGPGLYVFNTCEHFIRTIPTLPKDVRNPDDVDTKAEDHVWDETRYFLMKPESDTESVEIHGI